MSPPADAGIVHLDHVELSNCSHPAVAALRDPLREELQLVYFDGKSQAAAARELGISLPAMKARVHRGRAALGNALRACCRIHVDSDGGFGQRHCDCPACTSTRDEPAAASAARTRVTTAKATNRG